MYVNCANDEAWRDYVHRNRFMKNFDHLRPSVGRAMPVYEWPEHDRLRTVVVGPENGRAAAVVARFESLPAGSVFECVPDDDPLEESRSAWVPAGPVAMEKTGTDSQRLTLREAAFPRRITGATEHRYRHGGDLERLCDPTVSRTNDQKVAALTALMGLFSGANVRVMYLRSPAWATFDERERSWEEHLALWAKTEAFFNHPRPRFFNSVVVAAQEIEDAAPDEAPDEVLLRALQRDVAAHYVLHDILLVMPREDYWEEDPEAMARAAAEARAAEARAAPRRSPRLMVSRNGRRQTLRRRCLFRKCRRVLSLEKK